MWFHVRAPDRAYAPDAHPVEQRAHPVQRLRGALPGVSEAQENRGRARLAEPAAAHATAQPASSLNDIPVASWPRESGQPAELRDGELDEQPRPQRLKLPRRIQQI